MVDDTRDAGAPDPAARADELIEQGIASAQAEDFEAALDAMSEAQQIAEEAGIPDLAAAALINKGWVHWVRGELDAARRLYAEGADVARDAEDSERLKSALLNFAVASRQLGVWEEAVVAYEEYLLLVAEEPSALAWTHLDCGLCFIEMDELEAAVIHFEEAERIAQAEQLTDARVATLINRGLVTEREGDGAKALVYYGDAASMAREAGLDDLLVQAVVSEAFAHRGLGGFTEADALFSEAEDLYRSLGNETELANMLYWHALMLKNAGMRDRALFMWREEEPIRRRLGQDSDLGDCLFEQAAILRDRDEFSSLELLYPQAEEAYRRAGNLRGLSETQLQHARALRAQGRTDEALATANAGIEASMEAYAVDTECRLRGLRAMLLTESGDTKGAGRELDLTESASADAGLTEQATWARARRAYVLAREGASADEVVAQLMAAHEYGMDNGDENAARRSVLRVSSEIKSAAGDEYAESLDALRSRVRARREEAEATGPLSDSGHAGAEAGPASTDVAEVDGAPASDGAAPERESEREPDESDAPAPS